MKIVRQNSVPSSARLCRPIRIKRYHEREDRICSEQLKTQSKTKIIAPGGTLKIKHIMLFTMIDGKVCNAATATLSTMQCYICELTSKKCYNIKEVPDVNVEHCSLDYQYCNLKYNFLSHCSTSPIKKASIKNGKCVNQQKRKPLK